MSSKPYCTRKKLQGFRVVRKRPSTFICMICGTADENFIMDRTAMVEHAAEPEHQQRVKEEEDMEWEAWNAGAEAWKQAAGQGARVDVPPEFSLARWLPDDEMDWEEAEAEKKMWISNWIDEVEGARLQIVRKVKQNRRRQW